MFRLLDTRVFIGANLHCAFPAIAGHLEFASLPTAIFARMVNLQSCITSVLSQLAATEPFAPNNLNLPDDPCVAIGLTVACLAAEIQNLAAAQVSDFTIDSGSKGEIFALCGYQSPEVGVDAMRLACALVTSCLRADSSLDAVSIPIDLRQELEMFRRVSGNWHLDPTTYAIISAASKRNIPHYRLSPSTRFVQLGQGVHQHHIFESESDQTSVTGGKISHNKTATHHLLRSLGIPTPAQVSVSTFEQAAKAASQLGFPLVVKPSHGMQGIGVTVGVNDQRELAGAVQRAADARSGAVLLEKFVSGHAHRLLVVDGKLIAASQIICAHVTGDGIHSIEQLVALANHDPRRGPGFNKWARLTMDNEAPRMLAKQGYGPTSVPGRGQIVFLSATGNVSTGSMAIDVTGKVHPEVREMAELIAFAFKLDVAGLDYLTHDVARSYRDGGGAVCEVNACPGLPTQWMEGSDRDSTNARGKIVDAILEMHFPNGQTGRIPLIAIAGSTGRTVTSRMVVTILAASGKTTALTSSDGVFVGKHKIRGGDCAGGLEAKAVLLDPRVEAAVMELGCDGLIRLGMPIDKCDVAAVLDVELRPSRQDGIDSAEDLAKVELLVAGTASHYAVLNADDTHCLSMAQSLQHVPICWVSLDPDNPAIRTLDGKRGMMVTLSKTEQDAEIMIMAASEWQCVASIPGIFMPPKGTYLKEALFAIAIAYALEIPLEHIRTGLNSFQHDSRPD